MTTLVTPRDERPLVAKPARHVVVIGGGPAGLTAAYELTRAGVATTVLEKGDKVGGLARTESYKGFHFDMGGHRFFTKSKAVNQMWRDVLADQFLQRPRLSRIYYRRRFFNYPLKPFNALYGLGLWESLRIVASYAWWQIFPYRQEESFEQWVTNRFGRRLFQVFFQSYTEKVWGIPCTELKAEWAAQRIKDLSLKTAILSAFFRPRRTIKTLIEQFDYPRLGPGMMWRAVTSQVESRGGEVQLSADVVAIHHQDQELASVMVRDCDGVREVSGTDFVSSMPLTEFVRKLDPPPPPEILAAADQLKYRDFLTVCLIVRQAHLFPDNWIYIHDPNVQVGRIQNFKNWSPDMVADDRQSSLGLEYFCNEGDALWTMSDADLVELGRREIEQIGLARAADVIDGCVFRVPKSYPVYDGDYAVHLQTLKEYVRRFCNFQTIGRNGLHRYNNQDHAMLTGMLAVRNLLHGEHHDLWQVNADQEYHEQVSDRDQDLLARQLLIEQAFARLDSRALGLAVGLVAGVGLALATLFLVIQGGNPVGPNLGLLGQFFPGYRVDLRGVLLSFAYTGAMGFALGWLYAAIRNLSLAMYLAMIARTVEVRLLVRRFLEWI